MRERSSPATLWDNRLGKQSTPPLLVVQGLGLSSGLPVERELAGQP